MRTLGRNLKSSVTNTGILMRYSYKSSLDIVNTNASFILVRLYSHTMALSMDICHIDTFLPRLSKQCDPGEIPPYANVKVPVYKYPE